MASLLHCLDIDSKPAHGTQSKVPKLCNHYAYRNPLHLPKKQFTVLDKDGNEYIPDYHVLHSYAAYPYIQFNKLVTKGFIRDIGNTLLSSTPLSCTPFPPSALTVIPVSVIDLCINYTFCEHDGLLQIAYFVSCIISKCSEKKLSFALGFSGNELIRQIQRHIRPFRAYAESEIISICTKLLQSQYITHMPTDHCFGGFYDTVFYKSNDVFYEFNHSKDMLFQQYTKWRTVYDRNAWTVGSVIEIHSQRNGGWTRAYISRIDTASRVTVLFSDNRGRVMNKTVDRYNANKCRSSHEFLRTRQRWTSGSRVEIYSHSAHKWLPAVITDMVRPVETVSFSDQLKICYLQKGGKANKMCMKILDRWCSDVRMPSISRSNLGEYRCGTQCMIWSNTQKQWVSGLVQSVMPGIQSLIVITTHRNRKYQKVVTMGSQHVKPVTVH